MQSCIWDLILRLSYYWVLWDDGRTSESKRGTAEFGPVSEQPATELQGFQSHIWRMQWVTRDFSPMFEQPASFNSVGTVSHTGFQCSIWTTSELQGFWFHAQWITGNFDPISKAGSYRGFQSRAIGNFSPVPKSVSCRVFQSHAQIRELQGILVSCLNQMVIGDFSPMSE